MANEPNEEQGYYKPNKKNELQLVNNLLGEITRYLVQKLDRAEEPLNSFGLQTLRMSLESDTRISNILEAAREEVIRSMD
ncbi:hypothetical protein Tco_0424114 [Tanacetum coccineum]